jgi:hypothetical protein
MMDATTPWPTTMRAGTAELGGARPPDHLLGAVGAAVPAIALEILIQRWGRVPRRTGKAQDATSRDTFQTPAGPSGLTRGTVSALPSRTGVPRCPGSPVQLRRCPATVKPAARAAGRARSSGPWPRTSLGRRIVRAATATPARAVRRLSSSVDRRMLCPHRFLGVAARAGRRCPSSSHSVSRSALAGATRPLVTTSPPRAGPTPRSPSRSSPGR